MLIAGLSSGQKTGIAIVAALFVLFALACSFWLPRLNPDFPGRRVRLFSVVAALFAAAMLTAIAVLAKEKKETTAGETTTTATATTSTSGTTTASTPPVKGNPQAGAVLFKLQACASCHTFTPAGATGKVGPNLDNLAADAQKANRGDLATYVRESIVNPDVYVVPGFQAGVMPKSFGTQLKPQQIDDLVAYLLKK